MIKFSQVTKKFGSGKVALEGIDMEIEPEEFVFIVGPSGAGKTTLLRLITRDMLPTKGKIMVNEWDLNQLHSSKVPKLRRSVGMIFQDFKLLPENTAAENIALPLEIVNHDSKKIKKRVKEALEMVGLKEKINHFPVQFSAGELQRVSLARAIVSKPKIILADEPTGNLDPKTSWEIVDLLKKINKQGNTVVVATHDQDVVNSLKERVISLKEGRVIKDVREGEYQ